MLVVEKMTCQNGKCEYQGQTLKRTLIQERTAEEITYGKLWAEIELPKLLNKKEN
jgi:hypothetical protein